MQSIAKTYNTFGKVESTLEIKNKILNISAEEIQEVAKEIFNEDQLSTITYEPKDS